MKGKQILSLVVTSAILFSGVGMEAVAEPIKQDDQPAITADAEAEVLNGTIAETLEEETEEGTQEETLEEAEEGTQEETLEEAEEGTQEETKEGVEEGLEEETLEETKEETGEETKEELEEETRGEFEDSDLPEDSKEESTEVLESTKPSVLPIPAVHEHIWSVDWNYDGTYHWHLCDVHDCPVTEDSLKDGYGEHIYNDDGLCTQCGYDAMEGIAVAAEGDVPTYQEAYEDMIALKEKYNEGMTWTNYEPFGSKGNLGSVYTWKGGPVYGAKSGVGCMAFAFLLSDEAFNDLPARVIERGNFTFEDVKVGDILRVNSNSHSVIVLQKSAGGVTVAEANFKKSVHWGRCLSVSEVERADFIVTRYPKGYVLPNDPEADKVAYEGMADSLKWRLTNGGVLTISGNGAIPHYSENNQPWNGHEYYTIVIQDGVTGIGDNAFYQSPALSVYIPDSVTTIGQNAFKESELMAVTIPGSVRTIGNNAFEDCGNLTSATVTEGVKIIGDYAFQGCMALKFIDFPASITSVGAGAFMSCKEMVRVRFMPGSGNVTIGDGVFSQCWGLMQVTLPKTADSISGNMFSSCGSLSSLYIPASVQNIGETPFISCGALRTIYFGGSEAEWDKIASIQLKYSLQSTNTTVVFDAVFEDPFATDPDDPGDFRPGESESCTNHVDADHDGYCDHCGKAMPTEPSVPGEDKTDPDGSEKDPDSSGSNPPPSSDGSFGNSFGSSGGSSDDDGEDRSDNSDNSDNSGNSTISTTFHWNSDGSGMTTRTQRDGTVITITDHAAGMVETEVKLSQLAIRTANKKGEAVALPIVAVPVGKDIAAAQAITVYTQSDQLVKVAIPTAETTAGTVAVIVNGDGTTTVVKNSVATGDCVFASLPDGATVKIVDNSQNFSDVPTGAWYEDAVSFISARDLFYNTTESTFAPGSPMTYAMLATALARFDGWETDGGATWYEKSMEWAASCGISDKANPHSNITCAQLAEMLWKYQGSPAVDPSSAGDGVLVNDVQKAMDWAMKNGLVSVFEEGAWTPQGPVNRSQVAQIIMSFAIKNGIHSVQ